MDMVYLAYLFAVAVGIVTAGIAARLWTWAAGGLVALLGASLLFLLPVNFARHEFTLTWNEAVKIDWWIVFLYGGGIALGALADHRAFPPHARPGFRGRRRPRQGGARTRPAARGRG